MFAPVVLLFLALLVTACSQPPSPLDLPVVIHVAPELTEGERAGLGAAIEEWHAALGFAPVVGIDEATDGCGIFVRYESDLSGKRLADAVVAEDCVGVIRLRPGQAPETLHNVFAHELGHLFIGTDEHSDDEASIMWPKYGAFRVITDEDVAKVMARVGGGAP